MANLVKHRFASGKTDGADATQIQPSHWNDGHAFTGGAAGSVLARDLSDPTFGAKWISGGLAIVDNAQVGAINSWAPAGLGAENTLIRWTGASDAQITGITPAAAYGQIIIVENLGGAVAYFSHANAASPAAAQFANAVASGPTPIGPGGWIRYVYVGNWLVVGHDQGAAITPLFNSVDYFGYGAMAWTVTAANVAQCSYRLSGRSLYWTMMISTSVLSGTPNVAIFRAIPGAYDARTQTPIMATGFVASQFAMVGTYEPANRRFHLFMDVAQSQNFPIGNFHVHLSSFCDVL